MQTGIDIIVSLAQGVADALPELIPAAAEAIAEIARILTDPDNLSAVIDAALEIILALVDGFMDAIPTLIEVIPDIIANLVTAIIVNAPKLIEASIALILSLADGLRPMRLQSTLWKAARIWPSAHC